MRTTLRRMVLLGALAAVPCGPAAADDVASPRRVGEYLGFVVMCGCLPYESSHQEAAFYAMLVEEEGERYADTAAGYMRRIVSGDWRNTDTVCSGYICNDDYTLYLGEILAMIDMDTEPEEFLSAYDRSAGAAPEESVSTPLPSYCAWKPMNSRCQALEAQQ